MTEECWLVEKGEPHGKHDKCPGLLTHDQVLELYFESDRNGWSGQYSYDAWRKHAERTRKHA